MILSLHHVLHYGVCDLFREDLLDVIEVDEIPFSPMFASYDGIGEFPSPLGGIGDDLFREMLILGSHLECASDFENTHNIT